MDGLHQIGQFTTKGDDGRTHVITVYNSANGRGTPLFITNEGWEAAPVRDGVFRVYGTGMILRGTATIAR